MITLIDAQQLNAGLKFDYTSMISGTSVPGGALVDVFGAQGNNTISLYSNDSTRPSSVAATNFDVVLFNGNDLLFTDRGSDSILGGGGDDTILGRGGNDSLYGNIGNDSIFGEEGNDYIDGGDGNDILNGGTGNDSLVGVNPNTLNPGFGEVDYQLGGPGADRFSLGDANYFYYDDRNPNENGTNDYAEIADFNPAEGDTIQLKGRSSNYLLQVLGSDTRLLLDKPGNEPDELIAIIRGKNNLNLNSNYFTYTLGQDDLIVTVTLAVNPSSVTEDGMSNLVYTFTRTGDLTNPLAVNYTIGGTATNAMDYAPLGTSVVFQADASTATVIVDPTTDSTVEPDETVSLTLAAGTGYTIGTTNAVAGTIQNDDVSGNFILTLYTDDFVGGDFADTFRAQSIFVSNPFGSTLGQNDLLIGGLGEDTLFFSTLGGFDVGNFTTQGIETFEITARRLNTDPLFGNNGDAIEFSNVFGLGLLSVLQSDLNRILFYDIRSALAPNIGADLLSGFNFPGILNIHIADSSGALEFNFDVNALLDNDGEDSVNIRPVAL
jgi:hypothetical protein